MKHVDKVLITGGRGFIGVNLAQRLGAECNVRILDNCSRVSPTGWDDVNGEFIEGDILDEEALAAAMAGVSQVIHLAAYGSVIESLKDPRANFETNARGTLNVLHAAVKAGVQRFIFASTGGALIGDTEPPVHEQSLPKPISPYGASKLSGEGYCHAFAKAYGLETICFRFGNVYGPHSAHKKGAVTAFIKALLQGEPIVIYGDGTASRDYIHVEDLCDGIIKGLYADITEPEIFHLASGRETQIVELAEMLRKVAHRPNHPILFRESRRGEVVRNFADYKKAATALGFSPTVKLEEGLSSTWQWYANQDEELLTVGANDS